MPLGRLDHLRTHARGPRLLEAQAQVLQHVLELEQRRVVVASASAAASGRASPTRPNRRRSPARARRGPPRPARRRSAPRPTTAVLAAATALLITFTSCPCPTGPTCTISSPIASNSGRARSKSRSLAARHDRQRAVLGLGRRARHRRVHERHPALLRAASPIRRAAAGPIVDMSMHSSPGSVPGALVAEQHGLDLVTVDHHRDHHVAVRRERLRRGGDGGAVARCPLAPLSRRCGSRRSARTRRATRLAAMREPMIPRPMKPTRSGIVSAAATRRTRRTCGCRAAAARDRSTRARARARASRRADSRFSAGSVVNSMRGSCSPVMPVMTFMLFRTSPAISVRSDSRQ